jgi:hypothetical protein
MMTLPLLKRKTSRKPKSGQAAGRAKTSATRITKEKASTVPVVAYSSPLRILLAEFDRVGLSWRMSRASSAPTKDSRLSQLSTSSKRSGIWGSGLRVTLSARVCPTTVKEYSLSDLIDRRFPTSSILTAANCLGMIRREKRAGRKLNPIFEESLSETLRFWYNVAAALGIPRQQAIAPRFAPKLESIKAATLTDQYYVARNLTWNECETLMGFPEGWTVDEGGSLATQLPLPLPSS